MFRKKQTKRFGLNETVNVMKPAYYGHKGVNRQRLWRVYISANTGLATPLILFIRIGDDNDLTTPRTVEGKWHLPRLTVSNKKTISVARSSLVYELFLFILTIANPTLLKFNPTNLASSVKFTPADQRGEYTVCCRLLLHCE